MAEPIVVGFDDTEHSLRAVECAVREAQPRKAPVRLVHAYQWIPPATFGLSPGIAAEQAVQEASVATLDEAAASLRTRHPGLTVETSSVGGDAARALADASRDAALLVVGGRGRGGVAGQLLGSVALRVLSYAERPVMVVRGDGVPVTGRMMVGVDLGTPNDSADVLEFAFAEAARRGCEVHVVHVWQDASVLYLSGTRKLAELFSAIGADRRARLADLVEPWSRKHPDVRVSTQAFPGLPGRILVDSTRLADVLVIGGRARTEGHAGMRIGSLAHTVLHHAHCPVVVVPEH